MYNCITVVKCTYKKKIGKIEVTMHFSASDRPSYADDIEWLRPHQICEGETPALFKDGASKFDVVQVS